MLEMVGISAGTVFSTFNIDRLSFFFVSGAHVTMGKMSLKDVTDLFNYTVEYKMRQKFVVILLSYFRFIGGCISNNRIR